MLSSTISTERSSPPEILAAAEKSAPRLAASRRDQISTEGAAFLRAELQRQPAVRPEVIARARVLAADPNYPSFEALKKVAEQILGSPDLSEDAS